MESLYLYTVRTRNPKYPHGDPLSYLFVAPSHERAIVMLRRVQDVEGDSDDIIIDVRRDDDPIDGVDIEGLRALGLLP